MPAHSPTKVVHSIPSVSQKHKLLWWKHQHCSVYPWTMPLHQTIISFFTEVRNFQIHHSLTMPHAFWWSYPVNFVGNLLSTSSTQWQMRHATQLISFILPLIHQDCCHFLSASVYASPSINSSLPIQRWELLKEIYVSMVHTSYMLVCSHLPNVTAW